MTHDRPQPSATPTEVWQDQVIPGRWATTTAFGAAVVADRLPGEPLRLVSRCHRCGKPTGGGNVTHDGKPWCGCAASPATEWDRE